MYLRRAVMRAFGAHRFVLEFTCAIRSKQLSVILQECVDLTWFVMIIGALLGLGGAAALLFNFEIMMTERGMAMTISGVIALTGGAVMLALGFILQRLNQLLGAFNDKNGRIASPKPLDRPVVPVVSEPMTEPTKPGLLGAGAAGSVAGFGAVTSLGAAAGLGGAALALGGAVSAHAGGATIEGGADAQADLPVADIQLLEPPLVEPPVAAALLGESDAPVLPVATSAEFEAELQRALVEAEVAAHESDSEIVDDLTRLLNREPVKAADDSLASDDVERGTAENDEPDVGEAADLDEPSVEEDESISDMGATPVDEELSDKEGEVPAQAPASEYEALADTEQDAPATASPEELQPKPAILGSYKAGGRTYTMYADGKVEAVTDEGVERFDSLDALRKHLAET
jgi:hypothetical protein